MPILGWLFCLILVNVFFASCATILNTPRQEVTVTSEPSGATVTDGIRVWTTPAKISLARKSNHILTFFKKGYKPQTVHLRQAVSRAVYGNVVMPLGILCWGIDASNGSQWRIVPENVAVDFNNPSYSTSL